MTTATTYSKVNELIAQGMEIEDAAEIMASRMSRNADRQAAIATAIENWFELPSISGTFTLDAFIEYAIKVTK